LRQSCGHILLVDWQKYVRLMHIRLRVHRGSV